MMFKDLESMPKNVILSYSRRLSNYIRRDLRMSRIRSRVDYSGALCLKRYVNPDNKLMMVAMPAGAPQLATTSDVLIANGAKHIIIMGSAGAISKRLTFGDIVICNRALRDEGTSHHYIKSSSYIQSSKGLTEKLCKISNRLDIPFLVGPTWTTDAMFRETREEIAHYSKRHILTVEMEAAALFAIAKRRGIDASAIFSVSDVLYEKEWSDFHDNVDIGYRKLARIAAKFRNI